MIQNIQQALSHATDTTATEQAIMRQLTSLNKAWEEFEAAFYKLVEVVREQNRQAAHQSFSHRFILHYPAGPSYSPSGESQSASEGGASRLCRHHLRQEEAASLPLLLVDAESYVERPPTSALHCHIESLLRSEEGELERASLITNELAEWEPDQRKLTTVCSRERGGTFSPG